MTTSAPVLLLCGKAVRRIAIHHGGRDKVHWHPWAAWNGVCSGWRHNITNTEFDPAELHHWAEQLADDYLPDKWERVNSSPFARVAVNREKQLCYKVFLPRSPAASLTAIVKGSRATRARINAEALLLVGIDAPINVLWGTLPGRREYLFTVLAPGQGISDWLHDTDFPGNPEQLNLRRQLLVALGTFIGRMHACGFIHGALTPDNVLVTLKHERFRFTLIDNERNIHKNPPPGKMLLGNLMQLNLLSPTELSRTDRMRFFLAWRRQMRDVSPVEGKVLAAEAYLGAMKHLYEKDL